MKKDFVYLASSSPRREALLAQIGVPYRLRPADIEERPGPGEAPDAHVLRLAQAKAHTVWESLADEERRPVLAADTVVVIGSRILGKPADEASAMQMLAELSGRTHTVLTGVALCCGGPPATRLASSEVRFRATTAAERRAYCATGEPLDKAGGYGIQGLGAVFIEHIRGSYSAVMGLPLLETAALLMPLGFPRWLTGGLAE